MTIRDIYEAVLIEINKEDAQSFTIEEFNYVANKAILAFSNEKYNVYPANQQLSDDLRVVSKSHTYPVIDADVDLGLPIVSTIYNPTSSVVNNVSGPTVTVSNTRDLKIGDSIRFGDEQDTYTITAITDTTISVNVSPTSSIINSTVMLGTSPVETQENGLDGRKVTFTLISSDYFHLLSCRTIWRSLKKDGKVANYVFPARRLTYDMMNAIENNAYLKPAANRPFYQIFDHTLNSGTNDLSSSKGYQNKPFFEIHIGKANPAMELTGVEIAYIKLPEKVELLEEDIYTFGADNSQVIELPDYLKNEIVRRCAIYLIEKSSDPRVQTQPVLNQEIPPVPMSMVMSDRQTPLQQTQRQTQQTE